MQTQTRQPACSRAAIACRQSKQDRILAKAHRRIEKELDLVKFVHRQRLTTFATMALLNPEQRFVVDKMSTMVARESSDPEESSDNADLELEQENVADVQKYSRQVFKEATPIDEKLMSIYRIRMGIREKRR